MCMDGWKEGWIDGWIDTHTLAYIHTYTYQASLYLISFITDSPDCSFSE